MRGNLDIEDWLEWVQVLAEKVGEIREKVKRFVERGRKDKGG